MSVPPVGAVVTRTRALAPVLWAIALCAAVVALLGAGVRTGVDAQLDLDTAVSQALYAGDDRSTALDWLLEVLTAPGLSAVRYAVAVPVLVWLVRRRAWRTVAWVVVTAVLVRHLTSALKEFFGRVRPDFSEGGAAYETLSFPSGHSSGVATLVAMGLLLAWPRLGPAGRRAWLALGLLLALVVGLTRIWLGVHYPSDVVAGWALGLGWTLLTAVVFGLLPGPRRDLP